MVGIEWIGIGFEFEHGLFVLVVDGLVVWCGDGFPWSGLIELIHGGLWFR